MRPGIRRDAMHAAILAAFAARATGAADIVPLMAAHRGPPPALAAPAQVALMAPPRGSPAPRPLGAGARDGASRAWRAAGSWAGSALASLGTGAAFLGSMARASYDGAVERAFPGTRFEPIDLDEPRREPEPPPAPAPESGPLPGPDAAAVPWVDRIMVVPQEGRPVEPAYLDMGGGGDRQAPVVHAPPTALADASEHRPMSAGRRSVPRARALKARPRIGSSLGSVYRLARMEGPWREGRGIRYRVTFLDTSGYSVADAGGMSYYGWGGRQRNRSEVYPETSWGRFALYYKGEPIPYELEIVNTGGRPLRGLSVRARQETYSPSGDVGWPLEQKAAGLDIPELAPGASVILSDTARLDVDGGQLGSLQQTHLLVTASAGPEPGAGRAVLADDAHAGIADPPPGG